MYAVWCVVCVHVCAAGLVPGLPGHMPCLDVVRVGYMHSQTLLQHGTRRTGTPNCIPDRCALQSHVKPTPPLPPLQPLQRGPWVTCRPRHGLWFVVRWRVVCVAVTGSAPSAPRPRSLSLMPLLTSGRVHCTPKASSNVYLSASCSHTTTPAHYSKYLPAGKAPCRTRSRTRVCVAAAAAARPPVHSPAAHRRQRWHHLLGSGGGSGGTRRLHSTPQWPHRRPRHRPILSRLPTPQWQRRAARQGQGQGQDGTRRYARFLQR